MLHSVKALMCAAALGLLGGSLAHSSAATEEPAPVQPPPSAPAAAPSWDLDLEPPPGGEWLKDEEGKEYFLEEIPLYEGHYKWENPERTVIRIVFGATYQVASIDDEKKTVTIKIYRPQETPPRPPIRPKLSAEEMASIAASYRFEPPLVDRVRFEPLSAGLPERGQWRHGFDVADFNGDKRLDIVHGPPRKGGDRVVIFLGDGKGGFSHWQAARFPADAAIDYGDVAAADFNRDGAMDVAVASHLRGIQVFVGDGKGGFARWSKGVEFHPSGLIDGKTTFSSRALRAVDWNGDRRTDLVAFGEGPRLAIALSKADAQFRTGSRGTRVYLNQGDGTWKLQRDPGSRNYADDLTVADVDGDKRLDVLAASSVRGYKALLSLHQKDGSWLPTVLDPLRPGATVRAVLAEDFDGDRKTDLLLSFVNLDPQLGTWHLGVDLYLRRAGAWERRLLYGVEGKEAYVTALAAADVDGDRRKDIVAFDNIGGSLVLLGDGKGSFVRQASDQLSSVDFGCRGYRVRLADFDGDGQPEVVASFAGESDTAFRSLVGASTPCKSGGSLRVWDIGPPPTAAPAGG